MSCLARPRSSLFLALQPRRTARAYRCASLARQSARRMRSADLARSQLALSAERQTCFGCALRVLSSRCLSVPSCFCFARKLSRRARAGRAAELVVLHDRLTQRARPSCARRRAAPSQVVSSLSLALSRGAAAALLAPLCAYPAVDERDEEGGARALFFRSVSLRALVELRTHKEARTQLC